MSEELKLPPLPDRYGTVCPGNYWTTRKNIPSAARPIAAIYTAEQMQAYARQAIEADRASRPEAESEMPAKTPVCSVCRGSGVVDDGEIDCYSNGMPFENGPLKCVKDCPACVAGNAARDDARDAAVLRRMLEELDASPSKVAALRADFEAAIKTSKQGGKA